MQHICHITFCILYYTGCLRKKYGVAVDQYFENGKTQQSDIFRPN